jgi:hypothetical protein
MKKNILFLAFAFIFFYSISLSQERTHTTVEWWINDFLQHTGDTAIAKLGNPTQIASPYGEAVHFNGISDGFLLKTNPISGLQQFTLEAIFHPDSGGQFEQRFFHAGTIKEDRVLFEIRSVGNSWYLDGFVKSGAARMTLADSTKLHPLHQWYHVAFIVDNGKLTTYVNGKRELEGKIDASVVNGGITSIGVRQNKINWFKGAIYEIRITPSALQPSSFLEL